MITLFGQPLPISCPYTAYLLGFLWGDGHLRKSSEWNSYSLSCELGKADFDELTPLFMSLHQWNLLERERYDKVYCRFYTSTPREMCIALGELGYLDKHQSHAKVLAAITPEHHRLFVLGLFDADGNIYETQGRNGHPCICSHGDQDWSEMQNLLTVAGIGSTVKRRVDKKRGSRFSHLDMDSVANACRLYRYLYVGTPEGLGLTRKRLAFERVMRYVFERYGSIRYIDRIDWSAFQYDGLEVVGPVDKTVRKWQWLCHFSDGRKETRGGGWLALRRLGLTPEVRTAQALAAIEAFKAEVMG